MGTEDNSGLICANCGDALSAPVCARCDGGPERPGELGRFKDAQRLLLRGRAQLIFGAWALPWLFALLALANAQKGLAIARSEPEADLVLVRRLEGLRFWAAAVAAVAFTMVLAALLRR